MNIVQLEYFLAAARTLNYTQAAARMFTSRQNLSHAIKELERELGAKLFFHEGNALVLTAAGEKALHHAQLIVGETEKMRATFAQSDEKGDPLHILVGSNLFTFSPYDISDMLDSLPSGSFRIDELECCDCYREVAEKRADVAVVSCMQRSFPQCEAALLHQDDLYLFLNVENPLAKKSALSVADIASERLMVPQGYEFQLEPLVRMLRHRDESLSKIDVINSFGYVRKTVRKGEAIGIASAAFSENMPDRCTIRPLAEPACRMGLYVLYRKDSRKARSIIAFMDNLSTYLPAE